MQVLRQIVLAGKWSGDWSNWLKAARALSPPFLPPHSLALIFPQFLVSSAVPVIWSSRGGSRRFIKLTSEGEQSIIANLSDYGNSHNHIRPLAKHFSVSIPYKTHLIHFTQYFSSFELVVSWPTSICVGFGETIKLNQVQKGRVCLKWVGEVWLRRC